MIQLADLEKYYNVNLKNKIFCTKLCVSNKKFDILYNYEKKDEISKFVSNFTEYFPYYVSNSDTLECLDINGGISKKLLEFSKRCWNGPSVPSRDAKVNGVFGEVFLDFYERIIKKERLASTYASRRDFRSNSENKGFDNVLFKVCDNNVEFVFAEAKFVANEYNAKVSLIQDIKGKTSTNNQKKIQGHLTYQFMNDYITFIVEKNSFFSHEDKELLKSFFKELNDILINKGGKFVDFLINKNIKINCVLFAIFKNKSVNPLDYVDIYDEIENEAKLNLKTIGIKNYCIEIVFIPTSSESMKIKNAITEYYG